MPAAAAARKYDDEIVGANPEDVLTPRQLELLALYASGLQITEIATVKFLSPWTVQKILGHARDRVGAKNLTHLCVICVEVGAIRKNGTGYKPVVVDPRAVVE